MQVDWSNLSTILKTTIPMQQKLEKNSGNNKSFIWLLIFEQLISKHSFIRLSIWILNHGICSSFFYVPCYFRLKLIIALHGFLSFLALRNGCILLIVVLVLSLIHLDSIPTWLTVSSCFICHQCLLQMLNYSKLVLFKNVFNPKQNVGQKSYKAFWGSR